VTPPAGATVRPFRALHFDPRRVAIGDTIAPPFDVVSVEERSALAARSPYNMVHLILPRRGDEPHVHELLCDWRRDGVLVLDDEPAYYWLEERYLAPDGTHRTRRGFIGLVGIEPYERAVVLPHERVREAPVIGRLELLRATRAHLSPIFGVYHDPQGRAEEALVAHRDPEPMLEASAPDGTRYVLWRVRSGHETVAEVLAASTVLVADGHHRYETALRYWRERGGGDQPAGFLPVHLASADDGLVIYPTHRIVAGVSEEIAAGLDGALRAQGLEVHEVADPVAALDAVDGRAALAVVRAGRPALLAVDGDGVDASLAQDHLLGPVLGLDAAAVARTDRITYSHRADDAAARAVGDRIAILLRAPTIAQVEETALQGRTMPQKSTYFYPKTPDGFVIYGLDDCR
jgi:uncharacterized protein (DUF1015 family)